MTVWLDEMAWPELDRLTREGPPKVILPAGSLEQHGPHLPLGTDRFMPARIAELVAERLDALVAPALPYGYKSQPKSVGGNHFPGCASLDAITYISMVHDILCDLARHELTRIVLLDGHMENQWFLTEASDLALRALIAEGVEGTRIVNLGYWTFVTPETEALPFPDGLLSWELEHAAVMETSCMLHLWPDLVLADNIPDGPPAEFPPLRYLPVRHPPDPAHGRAFLCRGGERGQRVGTDRADSARYCSGACVPHFTTNGQQGRTAMTFDLVIRSAALPDGRTGQDIAVKDGRIAEIAPGLGAGTQEIDATGKMVAPPFVDAHFHIDATLSLGTDGLYNESGTLAEGIALWQRISPGFTPENFRERALRYCDMAVSKGLLAIRSHVDITNPDLMAAEVIAEVRREVAPYIDLQLVAFPQMGFYARPDMADSVRRVLDMGFDVVGGIPHLEPTAELGRTSITALCEIAAEHGAMVDMHCDENDDPNSRMIETLVYETKRLGLQGRVTGSHLTSMHSMDNFYANRLIIMMADAGLHVMVNPSANLHLQARFDTYPKRRGLARVPELRKAGCIVGFAQDSVLDPWYPLGQCDLLDIAWIAAHACHMTDREGLRDCFDAVTVDPAQIMKLDSYGLVPGAHADIVILDADDPIEAVRTRATRTHVLRRGKLICETSAPAARLALEGRPEIVGGF